MMGPSEVIALLAKNDIPAVIIGGVAMRLHHSTRATQDLDLSIPSTAVGKLVGVLYAHGYVIVCSVEEDGAEMLPSVSEANRWIALRDPGSLTFVARPVALEADSPQLVPHHAIEIESQIDILYDRTVPFDRLFHDACSVAIGDITVRYAAAHHLIQLKEARSDRSAADDSDIAFLHDLLSREQPGRE